MELKLDRPIAFFDLETTGINISTDRIVEIAILKVQPNGEEVVYTQRVNPTIPIPAGASEVHHIYDADIAEEPTFTELADKIFKMIYDCDLAGFNSNRFDVPMLVEEFLRAGIIYDPKEKRLIDAQSVFHKMEQRTLVAAYKFYCGKELVDAHSAEADIRATYEVLKAQIERYPEIENDMDFLHEFSQRQTKMLDFAGRFAIDEEGVEVFNFGKYKGQSIEKVLRENPGYYSWMMTSEFPLYTKKVLKDIKERIVRKG